MHLQLGQRGFDVTTRALVVATVLVADLADGATSAAVPDLIADRPAAIEIAGADKTSDAAAVAQLCERFAGPVGVRSDDAKVAERAVGAGASFVHDEGGLADPSYLRVIEATNVSLVLSAPPHVHDEISFLAERARWAEAAGIGRTRIVLQCESTMVRVVLGLGHVVMVQPAEDESSQGVAAIAVTNGARLISTNQVRATRRTIDTVSELLERREPASTVRSAV